MTAHTTQPDVDKQALWARLNGTCEALWPKLQPMLAQNAGYGHLSLEVLGAIDSTNSELMRRARQGQTDPALLVALDQTAGRGRLGKTWQSKPGASLTFSLGLPLRPADWSGLSLAVGISLAESLSSLLHTHGGLDDAPPPAISLKWPNDLWIKGHKLAGILVETALAGGNRYVVIGIGINISPPASLPDAPPPPAHATVPAAAPQLPAAPPTGLTVHAAVDAADALADLVPALLSDVLMFEQQGFAAFASRFAARDALAGQMLWLSDGTQGTGAGVDATGALLVHTGSGLRHINSAEVSVRPLSALGTGADAC